MPSSTVLSVEALSQASVTERSRLPFPTQLLFMGQGLCPRHDRLKILGPQLSPLKPACRVEVPCQEDQEKKTKDCQLPVPSTQCLLVEQRFHSRKSEPLSPLPAQAQWFYAEKEAECKHGVLSKRTDYTWKIARKSFLRSLSKTVEILVVSN